ncbi:unnamed protein product, partial [Sphacelaria rigidula]
DAITRALLERQGQRRLIGFMGAAAVTTASRAVDASVRPQSCGQRQPSNTGEHSSSTKPTVEHPWRPNDPTSSASTDPPSGFPVRPYPSSRSTPTRDVTD